MPPLTQRAFPSGALAALVLVFVMSAALAGCAGTPSALADIRYDLGPNTTPSSSGSLPAIKVLDVTAPSTLDSDRLIYRLSYADAQRTAAYANSHWTMPPAQLLTQRLRSVLTSRGAVLTGADGVRAPVLRVDLDEFEQVFDGQSQSHAAVTARATLIQAGKVIGQHTFIARAPASSADAAGGAAALAAASDDLVAQIDAWLGMQTLVAAQ
ncbi:ABC-type transport auxiliary lipoprotein family protein [Paraburkholderia phosphatilytica]|uniref:ABC-type transport auxiliary lipoprotein family protein n=1 Tax=Paraburkholderia phosphatilytica TaxID=2282883 RepID=UPI000E4E1384|nr:ABC-type transport auxiliary lipoprotein family protein [Paraburkholderia phosphatilytica]